MTKKRIVKGHYYNSLLPNGKELDIEQGDNEQNCGQRCLAFALLYLMDPDLAKLAFLWLERFVIPPHVEAAVEWASEDSLVSAVAPRTRLWPDPSGRAPDEAHRRAWQQGLHR